MTDTGCVHRRNSADNRHKQFPCGIPRKRASAALDKIAQCNGLLPWRNRISSIIFLKNVLHCQYGRLVAELCNGFLITDKVIQIFIKGGFVAGNYGNVRAAGNACTDFMRKELTNLYSTKLLHIKGNICESFWVGSFCPSHHIAFLQNCSVRQSVFSLRFLLRKAATRALSLSFRVSHAIHTQMFIACHRVPAPSF